MESSGIAILVLIGLALIEGVALGIWVWVCKRRNAELATQLCERDQELAAYRRTIKLEEVSTHLDGLTDEELAAYPRSRPGLDDSRG